MSRNSFLIGIIHKMGLGAEYSSSSGCANGAFGQPRIIQLNWDLKNITQKAWPGPSGCVVLRDAGAWQWTWNGAQLSRELSVNQSIALTLAHPPISQLYNSAHLWHVWQFRAEKIVTKQLCRHKVSWRSAFLPLWTATMKWLRSYLLTKLQLFNCNKESPARRLPYVKLIKRCSWSL